MDDTSDYKYSLPAWKDFFYQKLNSERNECELGKITHVLLYIKSGTAAQCTPTFHTVCQVVVVDLLRSLILSGSSPDGLSRTGLPVFLKEGKLE